MKGIMIAAPSSGSGKTTVTMGIIRALVKKGMIVSPFKTGPDYIDRAFLEKAAKKDAGNLDMHLQGREGLKKAFSFGEGLCVVEGAMGYFDGIYNTFENSSYDIADTLGINTVLVYTPKGEMFTAIPKIKGMVDFKNSRIKGIILNGVSKVQFEMMKPLIESYTEVKALGYLPKLEENLQSRHLGLVQSEEVENIDSFIERISEEIAKTVDLAEIVNLAEEIVETKPVVISPPERKLKIAIARDKAFSFYYRENLELMKIFGEITFFSPLADKTLPDCDFLYLGGGYPEVFKEKLSANKEMLAAIKAFADKDGYIFAECGGFMYLSQAIEGFEMVGIFKGEAKLTSTLQRFGYVDVTLKDDCLLGLKGEKFKAHEFHKSICEVEGATVLNIMKTKGEKVWECGYTYKNVYAGYPHINFLGNIEMFKRMMERIGERG